VGEEVREVKGIGVSFCKTLWTIVRILGFTLNGVGSQCGVLSREVTLSDLRVKRIVLQMTVLKMCFT